jgi:hypothetical protein
MWNFKQIHNYVTFTVKNIAGKINNTFQQGWNNYSNKIHNYVACFIYLFLVFLHANLSQILSLIAICLPPKEWFRNQAEYTTGQLWKN